ncbi:dipeptide transport ATP-binding protein DppD [Treponema primitia ZAS-2]|uniref:Dipeptide transport ATP-binding protein DppD n=1 Tax=Treponema primitia (strain ATCC BAA-887 / DSM 12427 / ZAS-2) TaxID=545694 RepID=F5YIR7_TREPZ|nr:ABC transporter ATP-binding protein [Treponema primitia]AEF84035.1 dipeptide transport ATP-binding protein DppD [Treponema primitia ZAS-2]
MSTDEVLAVEDLCCDFLTIEGIVHAVSGMNLSLRRGEIHGLVGESGCGKSVSSRAILGLLDKRRSRARGLVRFDRRNLLALGEKELRAIRGRRISMVFQDPLNSLSPLETVGSQIEEAIANHFSLPPGELHSRAASLLERVGLHPETARQYPFELSGGMQQRVMIAQAISCEPELLIADEPTTALDVTIQAQVLTLLKTLQRELSLSVLLITHNFAVVAETCDRVSVMYAGQIVETAATGELIATPAHPYSKALINCIPRGLATSGDGVSASELAHDSIAAVHRARMPLPVIPGFPPRLYDPPEGCAFAPRCSRSDGACATAPPRLELGDGHVVFCHHRVG